MKNPLRFFAVEEIKNLLMLSQEYEEFLGFFAVEYSLENPQLGSLEMISGSNPVKLFRRQMQNYATLCDKIYTTLCNIMHSAAIYRRIFAAVSP